MRLGPLVICSSIPMLLLFGNSPIVAQESPENQQLLSVFADSVRRVSDIAALTSGLQQAKDDHAVSIAWRETRKGWIAYRLGELEEGRDRLDEAVRYFDEAVYRDKTLAIGWVGLAEVKLLLERRGAVVKATMHQGEGDYYENAALRHLADALRSQPVYPAAVALLGRLLLEFDSPDFPDDLVEAIRLAAAHAENGPIPQLLLGRYLRKQRDFPEARQAFERFVELGGDRGLAGIELSRIAYATGDLDSAAAFYLRGASTVDSLGRVALHRDLAWFVAPAELQAFDQLAPDSIGIWIRRLWAERDAATLRPEGDRLKEHLRRWWFVQDHFRLVGRRSKARFGWGMSGAEHRVTGETDIDAWTLFQPGSLPESDPRGLGVDDRGVVYMRHGEPDARVSAVGSEPATGSSGGCEVANESWKYELPTGPIILHFCANEALGAVGPTTLVSMLPLDPSIVGARGALDVRFGLLELDLTFSQQAADSRRHRQADSLVHPLFHGANERRSVDVESRVTREAATKLQTYGQASIKLGLTTDSYPLDYAHDLEPTVQIFGLSRSAGFGRALVVFALRGDRIQPATREGRLFYPVKMRVTAVDTAHGVTVTVDTLRLFVVNDTIPKDSYLYGTLDVPLPAGNYFVRALLEQPGQSAAGAVGRADVAVPGGAGPLTLSDLVTGREASGLVWQHKGHPVPLNPLDAFPTNGSVELYYEVGGATAQANYRTSMDFRRVTGRGGKGKDEWNLTFTERADSTDFVVQRTIGLNELGPGKYLLIVTVSEVGSERSITREKMINIVPR